MRARGSVAGRLALLRHLFAKDLLANESTNLLSSVASNTLAVYEKSRCAVDFHLVPECYVLIDLDRHLLLIDARFESNRIERLE